MYLKFKHRKYFLSLLVLFLLAGFLTGCGSVDDKEGIIGIWKVNSSKVDGREIGDGLGWFDFKKDGTVDTRPRPGKYDSGKYSIDPEKGTILLSGDQGGSLTYNYKLDGDALAMDAQMPNEMTLNLECVRVSDYPITQENDQPDDAPVVRPGGQ